MAGYRDDRALAKYNSYLLTVDNDDKPPLLAAADDLMQQQKDLQQLSPVAPAATPAPTRPAQSSSVDDSMPSTSDFVKKLYKMLEDQSFQHVVSWGPNGDCFVVKDMNEFTKSILPRMFKHSNFASFVRQLNKYDFHKVKNTDDNQFGEHSWTFRHPDFHADRREALENIKRKVPAARKNAQAAAAAAAAHYPHHHHSHHHHHSRPLSPSPASSYSPTASTLPPSHLGAASASASSNGMLSPTQLQVDALQSQVRMLLEQQDEMVVRLRTLERNYQEVLVEMVGFQRGMAQQDGLMQSLIQSWLSGDIPPPPSQGSQLALQFQQQQQQTSLAGVGGIGDGVKPKVLPLQVSIPPAPGSANDNDGGNDLEGGPPPPTATEPSGPGPSDTLRLPQAQAQIQIQDPSSSASATRSQAARILSSYLSNSPLAASVPGPSTARQYGGQGPVPSSSSPSSAGHPLSRERERESIAQASLARLSEISRKASSIGAPSAGDESGRLARAGSMMGPPPPSGGSSYDGMDLGMDMDMGVSINVGMGMTMDPPPLARAPTAVPSSAPARYYNHPHPSLVGEPRRPHHQRPGIQVPSQGPSPASRPASNVASPASASAPLSGTPVNPLMHEGLQVYTVGQLMPRGMGMNLPPWFAASVSDVGGGGSEGGGDRDREGADSAMKGGRGLDVRGVGVDGGGGSGVSGVGGATGGSSFVFDDSAASGNTSAGAGGAGAVVSASPASSSTGSTTNLSGSGAPNAALGPTAMVGGNEASGPQSNQQSAGMVNGWMGSEGSGSAVGSGLRSGTLGMGMGIEGDGNGVGVGMTEMNVNADMGAMDEEDEVVRPSPPGLGLSPPGVATSGESGEGEGQTQSRRRVTGKGKAPAVGPNAGAGAGSSSGTSLSSSSSQGKLRVRRATLVPSWAVPPRVLLVDDDAVSRKLSSKFLQVFGCAIDVAVDGVGAVNKMNLEKYDLVLMDIVMPKLDGVSATSMIRRFDPRTPIISMTSNSKPNEILTYYSSGMNDILSKPFTKEGLLEMLERHLHHLLVIQQMSKVHRPLSRAGGSAPYPMLPLQSGSSASSSSSGSGQNPYELISPGVAANASKGNGMPENAMTPFFGFTNPDGSTSAAFIGNSGNGGRISPGIGFFTAGGMSMGMAMGDAQGQFGGMFESPGQGGSQQQSPEGYGMFGSDMGMNMGMGMGMSMGYMSPMGMGAMMQMSPEGSTSNGGVGVGEKRGLDSDGGPGGSTARDGERDRKRGRFEVVE